MKKFNNEKMGVLEKLVKARIGVMKDDMRTNIEQKIDSIQAQLSKFSKETSTE